MDSKAVLSVVALVVVLAILAAAAMAGFRTTTTRVAPGQPAPSADHPQSRCVWCHIEVR
ncbi:MAG: hypothetical protein ACNA76_00125 [Anaerosomatales bacterium]|nr:hypothetical protein [Coriobacteriia bacterium]